MLGGDRSVPAFCSRDSPEGWTADTLLRPTGRTVIRFPVSDKRGHSETKRPVAAEGERPGNLLPEARPAHAR
jgi:hypothetical protein